MLRALHIRNYILIDSLDVDFPEGLIIITGQTGAGKSILLGALSLLMGSKADAGVISEGADSCVVEGEFDSCDDSVHSILDENDIEWDGGHLVIRRVVHGSGRSRSFINDSPVPLGVLASIAARLVDIHSQHQSLMLADHGFQLSVLDHFAGNGALIEECGSAWTALQSIRTELGAARQRRARMEADHDYNASRYARLESASLRVGELEELEAEQRQLANAEEIKLSLNAVDELFNPQEDGGLMGLGAMLKEASRQLSRISRYVDVTSIVERLESTRIELDDVESELDEINSRIDVSPERLQAVEDRMSLLYDLLKKYSCSDIESLIAVRDELSEALFDSTALDDRINELEDAERTQSALVEAAAARLHESRAAASGPFSKSIEESVRHLELDRAVFRVELNPAETGPSGADAVSFLFSANGRNPVDVSKCASGGEISRIMLCLKAMMARFAEMPTMIFDEIDTGVSGSVADKMGTMICEMGKSMQVFAITHLPQVAAKGNAHFLVSKGAGERVTSTMQKLSPEERVMEIARMLSGSVITDAAVANARTLISTL